MQIRQIIKNISEQFNFTISSNRLIFLLTIYFGFILNLSFWKYVINHVQVTNFSALIFIFSIIFFIIFPIFVLFNIIILPYIDKFIASLFLLISASTNYYMIQYNIFIDSDMIRNTMETNTQEVFDLFTNSYLIWIFFTAIIPITVLIITKIKYKQFKKELTSRLLYISLLFILSLIMLCFSFKNYASFGRNNRNVRKLMNTTNYINGTIKYYKKKSQAKRKFEIIDANVNREFFENDTKTILVLIIGETARSKNFSLKNYKRLTNPLLSKQNIIYFDNVNACGTSTAISLPCMFSHKNSNDFDVDDFRYTENLLDLLKKGNYNVIWRENDGGCKGVCSRIETEEIIKNKSKFCNDKYCYDEAILDGLEKKLLDINQDTVIVLHSMGSHGPAYYNRYKDKFKIFTPTCDTADLQNCTQEEIINTYDNTIVYTDYIVSSTIDILKKFPQYKTSLIYMSDHGESLGENNIYLHGLPYKIAPAEQKEIPLIVWISETMKKYDYIDYNCLKDKAKNGVYSHDNLFHSILGLLHINTKVYNKDLDLFNSCIMKKISFMEK